MDDDRGPGGPGGDGPDRDDDAFDAGNDGFDGGGFDGGGDGFDEGEFDEFDDEPLDEHETALIRQDLTDLADFEAAFRAEGYRGVAVWCHDCVEEHYFPWEMLRENLRLLLETGETPVHEPAFQPEPDRYVPWDYARGYVDALRDVGAGDRVPIEQCGRCGLHLQEDGATGTAQANFCPRCGSSLLGARLVEALAAAGLDKDAVGDILRAAGLPGDAPR